MWRRRSADEKAAWKALPFDEEHYRETEVDRGADGRSGLLGTGADVGAANAGCARHARRIYRRGGKDGDPGAGDGEGIMRLVPEMTPKKTFAQYKAYVESLPEGCHGGGADDPLGRCDCGGDGQSYVRRRRMRCARSSARRRCLCAAEDRFR